MGDRNYWTRRRRMPRRALLRGSGAGALGAGAWALVGCGDDDDATGSDPTQEPGNTATAENTPAAGETPTAGAEAPSGQLVAAISQGSALDSFNPVMWANGFLTPYRDAVADSLLKLEKEGEGIANSPAIAESYEITDDGLQVTFNLREGVLFHDGSPVTADDVAFSYELVTADEVTHARKTEWIAALNSVEATDDSTVVVALNNPYTLLLSLNGMFPILPRAAVEAGFDAFGENPIAAGPWSFVSGTVGQEAHLAAVESHYRKTPFARDLVFRIIPEEGTRVAQIQTGEAQLADISAASAGPLEGDGVRIARDLGTQSWWLTFMDPYIGMADSPLSNPMVRDAMSHAVNRQGVVDGILSGEAVIQGSISSPYLDGYLDLPADEYNLTDARAMLEAAGFGDGFETDFYISQITGGPQVAEWAAVLASDWGEIGIDVNVLELDAGALLDVVFSKSTPGIHILGLRGPTDPARYGLFIFPDGSFSYLNSEELGARMQVVSSSADADERTAAWEDVQQTIYDDGILKMLWSDNILTAVGDDVEEWESVPGTGFILRTEHARLA